MATWPTIIDDDGSGMTGSVINNALFNSVKAYIDDTPIVVDIPFNAANYGASSGTWTVAAGQVTMNRYLKIGKLKIWGIAINGATVTSAGADLIIFNPDQGQIYPVRCAVATKGDGTVFPAYTVGTGNPLQLAIRGESAGNWGTGSLNFLHVTAIILLP
jgi:hypothetical protein